MPLWDRWRGDQAGRSIAIGQNRLHATGIERQEGYPRRRDGELRRCRAMAGDGQRQHCDIAAYHP
jgi:hypothetical protein